jgi:hypothetical protein
LHIFTAGLTCLHEPAQNGFTSKYDYYQPSNKARASDGKKSYEINRNGIISPQKSQIKSAHLKFVGSNLSERSTRLHEGQLIFFDTKFSPKSPSCCFVVAIIPPRFIAHATCLTACLKKI